MKRPIIGVTLDIEQPSKTGYSREVEWYALRKNYTTAIIKHGAIVVPLTHDLKNVDNYIKMIDGLVVTGGHFDISPEIYGNKGRVHKTVTTKNSRTEFEFSIVKKALKKKIPFMGICGGEQLLNVVLGGTLIQHVPDEIKNALVHEQKTTHDKPAHSVRIIKGTLLHKILGVEKMSVNSSHHQAVKKLGKSLVASAISPDGVVEAIELKGHPFCIGLEWHPEYEINKQETKLFAAFVKACAK